MVGYSGSPLVKKLGIKPSTHIHTINAPKEYGKWLGKLPQGAAISNRSNKNEIKFVHAFFTERNHLEGSLNELREWLSQDGVIWISWPKKASKVLTDITENVIRQVALPLGYVDVKVCAVTEVWSGLKLVIRISERKAK